MKIKLISALICSFILAFSFNAFPKTITARVVGISDGDTIKVLVDNREIRIRLYGIDCPEKNQAFGKRAKQFTSGFAYGKVVQIESIDRDRYGRFVALVYVGNSCLNEELVRNGFAWVYFRYCKKSLCHRWHEYQDNAKNNKRGLWADPNPAPPWDFRKKH